MVTWSGIVMQALNSTLTAYLKNKVKLPRKEVDLFTQAFNVYNQTTSVTI